MPMHDEGSVAEAARMAGIDRRSGRPDRQSGCCGAIQSCRVPERDLYLNMNLCPNMTWEV